MRRSLLALLLSASLSSIAAAQQLPPVTVGTRVRVRIPETAAQPETPFRRWQQLRGEVTRVAPDTIVLRPAPALGEIVVPMSMVRRLDRSTGVPSAGASALGGGILGALAGALWLGLDYDREGHDYGVTRRSEAVALGAGLGLVVGAVVGAIAPTERWHRVRLPR